jgi:deoxyribodipyrimidine photo-lyase
MPGDPLIDSPRVAIRRPGPPLPEGHVVLYWMQRAQRATDNPALDLAIELGNRLRTPVVALFVVTPRVRGAEAAHYRFMLDGLAELPAALASRGVGCLVRHGHPVEEVARACVELGCRAVVGDENPLREPEGWRRDLAAVLRPPFWTVDADVIVPTTLLEKEQFSAGTIRPRIHRQLEWCLQAGAEPRTRIPWREGHRAAEVAACAARDAWPRDALPASIGITPGSQAAQDRLRRFLRDQLPGYASARNRPELDGTSRLSAYLHFGQIGPREVALAVRESQAPAADRQAFLEEFIVRRELAVNFVRFNPRYDSLAACERWARATLDAHRADERPWRYDLRRLEAADTHDPLWNAAQRQMMTTGWMHGYVRMYWAKKILEWASTPEEAMESAIALNDRYELDGRDPNGYAGIAWAIGGKHDRAWGPERPIYGKVRYMSLASTGRKFDSRAYIARWTG